MTEQDKRDRLLAVVARSSVSTDVQVEALDYVRDLEDRVKALEALLREVDPGGTARDGFNVTLPPGWNDARDALLTGGAADGQ